MSRKFKHIVLWFDDEFESRKILIQSISEKLGLRAVNASSLPIKCCDEDNWPSIVDRCASNLEKETVELIVVDDNLTVSKNELISFTKGSSLCGALRDRFKDIPIVGVSNAARPQEERVKEYTYFFEFLEMKQRAEQLSALVEGFRMIRHQKVQKCKNLWMSLLGAPQGFYGHLNRILPLGLRVNDVKGMADLIFRWLDDVVFGFQGELLDSINISAMIGLEEKFFLQKVVPRLDKSCEYRGVFAGFWGRWFWRNETLISLAAIVGDDGGKELSHYCEYFVKNNSRNLARCGLCQGHYTEVAAYKEQDGSNGLRVPAHRRCVVEIQEPRPIFSMSKYVLHKGANG